MLGAGFQCPLKRQPLEELVTEIATVLGDGQRGARRLLWGRGASIFISYPFVAFKFLLYTYLSYSKPGLLLSAEKNHP